MRVRKLDGNWKPSENPQLQIGEIIDISNPKILVEQGLAVYVDEDDVDYERVPIAWEYRPKSKEQKYAEKRMSEEVPEEEKKRIQKEKRVEQMKKAREARWRKIAEEKLKKQEKLAKEALAKAIEVINENPL